jgi:glycosyltransferase involved in cell wall biosynthesis
LKVLSIGPAFPLRGGIANFNLALSREFARSGHITEIISFSFQYPRFLFPGKTQQEKGPAPSDIKIKSLISSVSPFSWSRTFRYARAFNPNLVVVHYWMPFMAIPLGRIIRRIKRSGQSRVIAVTHNIIPHEKFAGWKALTRYFLKSCDGFIAMSKTVSDDLITLRRDAQYAVIPHPVYDIFGERVSRQTAAECLRLPATGNYLLFFGLIRKYKGLELLLKAMPYITTQIKDIKLIIAGEFYSGKHDYFNLINDLQIIEYVHIVDRFIPAEEVKYYFSIADLVVQPYISATQSGITQIAYNFEVPMIVTNVGGLAELVPDGKVGYVVPVDYKQVARAVIDFFEFNRSGQFRDGIKEQKEKYSWENMVKGIQELYDHIGQKSK